MIVFDPLVHGAEEVEDIEDGRAECEEVVAVYENIVVPLDVAYLEVAVDHYVLPDPEHFHHYHVLEQRVSSQFYVVEDFVASPVDEGEDEQTN